MDGTTYHGFQYWQNMIRKILWNYYYQSLGRPNHDLCLKRRLPPKTVLKEYILNMFDIKLTDSQGEFLTRNVETADQDASCTYSVFSSQV